MHVFRREVGLSAFPYAVEHGATALEDLPLFARHVPYEQILKITCDAWVDLLETTGVLSSRECAVVNVNADYLGELKMGPCEVQTTVARIGTSSFAFAQELTQASGLVAAARTTLVHKDFAALRTVPLTETHRQALAQHLAA